MTHNEGSQGGQNPEQDPKKQGPGHQGQGYPGQNYPGQNYPGQSYPAENYPAQNYPGQNYPGPAQGFPVPGGQQYAYPPVAPIPGTNGLAIASLIVSLISCGPIGLILGIVSLSQIKKSGEQGRGLAIAGVVIGAITALLWIVAIIIIIVAATEVANDPYYYEYNY